MLHEDDLRNLGEFAERYLRPQQFTIPIPTIIEKTARGERMYDLFSRLMEDRIIILGTPIVDFVATITVGQLLYLQKDNKTQDISIYINSPGGEVNAGLAIYDTMQFVTNDCATFCLGSAMSMSALLLAGGTKGKRYSLPHSRIMVHQPAGGVGGTAADISRRVDEVLRLKAITNEILAHHTGQPLERIEKDVDRDHYLSPEQAKEYGLIDEIVTTLKSDRKTSKGD